MSSESPDNGFHEISNCIDDAVYASDQFRMFGFKIKRCSKRRSHDWTLCPFSHPGEKACRRDPRSHHYEAVACPYFRVSNDCPQGQLCPYAHGVFEYWLHPTKYRTRLCNAGAFCSRKVCFFAHSMVELRTELDFRNFRSCMYGIPENSERRRTEQEFKEVEVEVEEEEEVEDFLASLSGLKVAELAEDNMPWNLVKKMVAVDGSNADLS